MFSVCLGPSVLGAVVGGCPMVPVPRGRGTATPVAYSLLFHKQQTISSHRMVRYTPPKNITRTRRLIKLMKQSSLASGCFGRFLCFMFDCLFGRLLFMFLFPSCESWLVPPAFLLIARPSGPLSAPPSLLHLILFLSKNASVSTTRKHGYREPSKNSPPRCGSLLVSPNCPMISKAPYPY